MIDLPKPCVHLLCHGAYLQEPISLSDQHTVFPLSPLGSDDTATMLGEYVQSIGVGVDSEAVRRLKKQGELFRPVLSLVVKIDDWKGPEHAEERASSYIDRLMSLVSWASGNEVQPFGYLTLGPEEGESYFRLTPPIGNRRTRLGFGNVGEDFTASLNMIWQKCEEDERFEFILSMLRDANEERNARFRVARFYNCLEAFAYKLKKHMGSRDAVRKLLGIDKGKTGQMVILGKTFDYDIVLGAGILRDQLFHGVRPNFDKANSDALDTFDLLNEYPDEFASSLKSHVELEVLRWATNRSNGQL